MVFVAYAYAIHISRDGATYISMGVLIQAMSFLGIPAMASRTNLPTRLTGAMKIPRRYRQHEHGMKLGAKRKT